MSVSQRSNGRWCVKYRTDDGWKQRTFPASKEAEAREFDAQCAYDERENSRMTVAEAVLTYLKNVPHVPGTIQTYHYVLRGLAGHLSTRFVDTLNRRDLESIREICRERGVRPSTMNMYTSKLKAAFSWCAEQELIPENPWARFRNVPATITHRDGTLEDFQKIYALLPKHLQWVCRTAIALCLRPGEAELFSLRWTAFDWKQGLVNVYMPKVRDTKKVFPHALYMEEAHRRYCEDKQAGHEIVCRGKKDRPLNRGVWRYAWRKACEESKIKMPPYAMRHIAASEMLAGGADLAAVSAQLGHRSINTTASYYTHVIIGAQRRAAQSLPLVQLG